MTSKWLCCCALGALTLSAPALAGNDCQVLQPDVQPDVVAASYDPLDASATQGQFAVDVRTSECPPTRNLFLELGSTVPGTTDGRIITLTGPGNATLQLDISDRGGTQPANGDDRFNVKQGLVTLYLRIDRGQLVPPGTYRAQMTADLRLDQGNNTQGLIEPFEIVINVQPIVGLAAATGTEINLGELVNGDQAAQPVTFDAYANVDYELRILSDNGFSLRLDGKPSQPGAGFVPRLDSTLLSTSSPVADFDRPTGVDNRRRHSLNVQVPTIDGLPAGNYEDYLTVEISARVGG